MSRKAALQIGRARVVTFAPRAGETRIRMRMIDGGSSEFDISYRIERDVFDFTGKVANVGQITLYSRNKRRTDMRNAQSFVF